MLQRIQSIYLLATSVCAILVLLGDFAVFQANENFYDFNAFGISKQDKTTNFAPVVSIAITSFSFLMLLLPVVNIFLYKNRSNQVKVGYVIIGLALGVLVSAGYYLLNVEDFISTTDPIKTHYKFGLIWPVIGIIFVYLANRAIKKDEKLVRSVDRLR